MRIVFPSGNIYEIFHSYNCVYLQDLIGICTDDNPMPMVHSEEVFTQLILPQKIDMDILKILSKKQVVHGLAYFGCTLLNDFCLLSHHNKYNLDSILKIQRYWRKYQKYKQFTKYINSTEFAEWIYNPSNIGAKVVIKKLNRHVGKISL